jgi:hypothetical protein
MKKIYFTIVVLLAGMICLAYLYFSKLNKDTQSNDSSLFAATAQSGFVFSVENNKSVLDLLQSQDLLQGLLSEENLRALQSLKKNIIEKTELNRFIHKETIYISLIPDQHKGITYTISTQLNESASPAALLNTLKMSGFSVEQMQKIAKISFQKDSSFYLSQKGNLLQLSPDPKLLSQTDVAQEQKTNRDFAEYIKTTEKINKNSLASLYVDFNRLEDLFKKLSPTASSSLFQLLHRQNAFASLNYNYSKEKILFTGSTVIKEEQNYLNLFTSLKAGKTTIDAILPEQTANYTIYSISDYNQWSKGLGKWLQQKNMPKEQTIAALNSKYHLNLEETFPKYFKDQLLNFQLKNTEKMGAINLKNGDKLAQLLLDISENVSEDIKVLKEPMLLYWYFGAPFEKFKTPYYTIIDNYMVFSNRAENIQTFLNSYRSNSQLLTKKEYADACAQLPASSNIVFYLDQKNSEDIALHDLFRPAFEFFNSRQHIGQFSSMIYQLQSENKKFQSNLLISKKTEAQKALLP